MAYVSAQEILRRRGIQYVASRKGKYTTKCVDCSQGYLSVEIKKDGVLWYCQSCKRGGGEHFNQPDHDGGLGEIKAIFDYVDEVGKLLFQVLRFEPVNLPKQFRQRTGPDQAKWSIKGVRIVPFKLPELIEAVGEGSAIFVCEGEKDVLTLRRHNINATCNPMGAGKWWPEFNKILTGADVIICGDNDAPGRDHVALVVENLLPVASRVRVLDLATIWPGIEVSDDISDWFDRGHGTPEELWHAVERLDIIREGPPKSNGHDPKPEQPAPSASPLETICVANFAGMTFLDTEWAVHDRIPMANVSLLGGDGAAGKTTIALQLCVAIAAGLSDWLGGIIDQTGPVLFFSAEEDQNEIGRRLTSIIEHRNISFTALRDLFIYTAPGQNCTLAAPDRAGQIQPTELYERIKLTITSLRPKLVVLESSADLFGGNEIDRVQVRQFITLLRALAMIYGSAVVLLSHPSLSGLGSGSGMSGSTAWNNSARSRLYFTNPDDHDEDEKDTDRRLLKVMKSNYGPPGEIVKCKWHKGVFIIESELHSTVEQAALDKKARDVFLACLDSRNKQLNYVNNRAESRSRYAPKIFAKLDAAKPLTDRESARITLLERAMNHLLENPKDEPVLTVEPYDAPSKGYVRLVRRPPAEHKMQRADSPADSPADLFKTPC